jgi:glyoxylase-like metal-dependent hydrolase (beta-lactamase superfamily II)
MQTTRKMPALLQVARLSIVAAASTLGMAIIAAQQPATPPDPIVRENATEKISGHVYVIPDFNVPIVPNVGIIVGSKGTLVVDTGLGPRNGQTVLREVQKVSKNANLYVVATHFHPEHALGEPAFPSTAKIIRAQAQQKDIDEFGLSTAEAFSARTPVMADLLKGVRFRKADITFDREYKLDLGGVTAKMLWLGPTHTRGDTVVWLEPDRVLFTGDIVMPRRFAFGSPYSSVKTWIADFDRLEALMPARIVPSHGLLATSALIDEERMVMKAIQARAEELKRQGKTADEAAQTIQSEFQSKYPNWTGAAQAGKVAYEEQP